MAVTEASSSVVAAGPAGAIAEVAALVAESGVAARPLRRAIARLTEGPQRLEDLVRDCALPRRSVERLIRAAGADLEAAGARWSLRADVVDRYREEFGYDQLRTTEPTDPFAALLAARPQLTADVAAAIAAAPAPDADLDHVAATAETVARRGLWLDAVFDLAGARVLCVGDHDLTSIAVCAVNPRVAVTVVDVDERLLGHVAARAAQAGAAISCRFADLRFGLPPDVTASADVVFTDPPYTPEGVELFLGRGLQGLRDRRNGRLVMAYGFSELHPALGLKVQRAAQELDLTLEAMLPGFHRYDGAQAIGSAAALYCFRPTARTWQILDRRLAALGPRIYTRGANAVESEVPAAAADVLHGVATLAVDGGPPPSLLVGDRWPPRPGGPAALSLATLFADGAPAPSGRRPWTAAIDLSGDPGAWLVRALLAVNADRVALLVPDRHPDLRTGVARRALAALVAPKYRLEVLPGGVVATAVAPDAAPPLAGWLLRRAHGRLANVWREGLIRLAAAGPDGPLTKNAARARIGAALGGREELLDARLLDLPRAALPGLLAAVEASAGS